VRHRPPIELGWAGDIVVGSHYGLPPNGGRDQFDAVDHLLRAPDLMIGNYEGTLSRGGRARCGGGGLCYLFQAPPERARNLAAAGFDVMNLANNHALDFGEDSRRQTVRALERVGVRAAGLPGRVTIVRVEDTTVGIVGMSPYPGTTNMRSRSAVHALVASARRRADVVVVAMHAGLEGAAGAHVPRGADYGTDTRGAVHAAIDAGADVVFGSGPHVVRGVERYRGRYVVYSSGNFAGWRNFGLGGLTSQSGVVRMTFDHRGRPTAAAWDGVVLRGPGIPWPDRSGEVVRRVASLSRADFGRRAARFTRDGSFR
jgi:poly-gamma-glutamate capsule biosynthesis protein CapA/YwtB (metallophosphatase superfamily)